MRIELLPEDVYLLRALLHTVQPSSPSYVQASKLIAILDRKERHEEEARNRVPGYGSVPEGLPRRR